MKVFVTGVGGQLGHDVINELTSRGYEAIGSDVVDMVLSGVPYVALDITDKIEVERVIAEIRPDAIIHCAAWKLHNKPNKVPKKIIFPVFFIFFP